MTDLGKLKGVNLGSLMGMSQLEAMSIPSVNFSESDVNPARWTYDRLAEYVTKFQNDLDDEHEIGGYIANFPNGVVHFSDIGYWGPDIISFDGHTSDGNKIKLIQNIAQLNVTLVSVPKINAEPTRIGFDLPNQEDE